MRRSEANEALFRPHDLFRFILLKKIGNIYFWIACILLAYFPYFEK
jgi:hypothetical protein